ncbi:hypothetical protein DLAC_05281 [Tieghemostelium lacteum]|uniref:Uncharacterized protein n=1 Tax=Tieghemostelium lacteum TaxID=361077 RepID=A0A151ZJ17_TIELA|nr:hypothetical protein DLAC_05281 [Tieghemostelium lacteum]|eukprot:KYQ93880.1 hypothetical protein DLAC_05281 [Tieghemostelium lacteum]
MNKKKSSAIPIPNSKNNSLANSPINNNSGKTSTSAPTMFKPNLPPSSGGSQMKSSIPTTTTPSTSSSLSIPIKKPSTVGGGGSIFSAQGQKLRMSYSPSTNTSSSYGSLGMNTSRDRITMSTSSGSSSSSSYSSSTGGGGFLRPSVSNNSISSMPSSSPFSPIPSPKGLYVKSSTLTTSGTSSSSMNSPSSASPNIFLQPSPNNSLQPMLPSSSVYSSVPKTKTIGFAVPEPRYPLTTSQNSDTDERDESMDRSVLANQDLDFGTADDSSSDSEHFDGEEDYEEEEEEEEDDDEEFDTPPQSNNTITPINEDNNNNSKHSKNIKIDANKYINIETLNPQQIEKMVLEGWNDKIPRYHQKEACISILQNILELYNKSKNSSNNNNNNNSTTTTITTTTTPLSDKDIFKIPKIKSEFNDSNNNNNNKQTTTTTTTSNSIEPRNYLIQHAAGSGKSLTIACLVFNLYRLIENNTKKYDLILVLNDRRHLDTQLGSIVSKFLKDNDMTSIHHPGTVASLNKILKKGKTRVVITTMQKFTNLIEQDKFQKISSKYKSIAMISDEAHRSHGKSMSRKIHSVLTGETRQNSNITYFCFTCTPTARCLEMFGETKGNLKVPFHCYSLEKALQDKVVMSVIDNYTTVSILTKISQVNQNTSQSADQKALTKLNQNNTSLYNEKRTSYHLLKNSQSDRKIIQEKASYIIKHFVKLRELVNNSEFSCRAMLVTSNRNQILVYKTVLEQLIRGLPKDQRFDIIATFSPFIYRKKVKMDSDEKINGKYSDYFRKRDGISDIIKKDKKHRVQLIIVADKLQTGFDEPSLAVMYVDKTLRGANAVQTLGRLSRVVKGKKASYVVDFVNSRKEISDSFSQYWRETQLKGATRKTVLEHKLNRMFNKLSDIEPLANGKLNEAADYILKDDERRKKEKKSGSITDDIAHFVELSNQLFWENTSTPMTIRFLESVKFLVCQTRLKSQMTSIRGLLVQIENKSTLLGSSTAPISPNFEDSVINAQKVKMMKKNRTHMSSSDNIISKLNKQEEYRALDMIKKEKNYDDPIANSGSDLMDLDAENLEFAKEMWSSNPEFKLRSSLLAPVSTITTTTTTATTTTAEEQTNENSMDDQSFGFNTKMLDHVDSIEQVIEVVVEFVSRNGTTFENFIQNQSLVQLFPFIDPHNPNHHLYKTKLEKARQELYQKQIQLKLESSLHQKNDNDIVMSDSSNNNNNSNNNSLKSSVNSMFQLDIPLPVPLPSIIPASVIGKPHSEGRADDCLLEDCILSFCHDLDSKDSGLRVYAIQTLVQLSNKGIHKNNLHEVVGSINKILMNRHENISIKMISLDLLGQIALHDDATINQIIENQVILTVLKLIQSAEEPLKAKSCKFLAILSGENAIISNLIELQGIVNIVNCLDSYDFYVTEHALKLLIALSHEDRTTKIVRSSIENSVWTRLDHHKIHHISELSQQLKTLLTGPKRTLSQFQPSINAKRIRSTHSMLTKSN